MTRRRAMLKLVQYGLGIVALVWLVRAANWSRVLGMVGRARPSVIVAIVAVTAVGIGCRFWLWHVLLNGLGRTRFADAARVDLTVSFVNQVLPSRVSGRSVAPAVLRHYTGYDWSDAVTVAGLHTALYALLNGAVALCGLLVFAPALSPGLLAVLGLSTALYLVVGPLILLAGVRLDRVGGVLARLRGRFGGVPVVGPGVNAVLGKVPAFSAAAAATFRRLATDPRPVGLYAAGWTVALVVVPGVRTWLLLDALGSEFSPAPLLPVALVLAYAVTLLPLTPGGVGVAEASATVVLAALGVPASVVAPAILVDRFLGVYLPALAGWYPVMTLDLSTVVPGAD